MPHRKVSFPDGWMRIFHPETALQHSDITDDHLEKSHRSVLCRKGSKVLKDLHCRGHQGGPP